MQDQRRTASTQMAMLKLTNTSSRTCRVNGWVTVTLANAAGEPVTVPTEKVNQPGAPVVVDLPAGTAASAGIKWTICTKGESTCPAGNTLMVGPPNDPRTTVANLSGFPAPERSAITMKSLQIGSLQPSGQGVVAW